ncbi:MAG TPA: hypothetical protein VG347_00920 [Verrucomicrobiae bacterium]|nr:hypothetical protein [Verrucomicrobiae bacterium]
MNPKWAEENLQTIRTLMERSALYRRALAPIMLLAGSLGIAAACSGILLHFDSMQSFGILWLSTAVVVFAGTFAIARRQAIKDREIFWSSPTRRVAIALLPPLLVGFVLGGLPIISDPAGSDAEVLPAAAWILFYGCALHSAGFFMPRGIKVFGWVFMASACGLLIKELCAAQSYPQQLDGHCLMGFFFGGLHLAYGIYLYFTEKKNPA